MGIVKKLPVSTLQEEVKGISLQTKLISPLGITFWDFFFWLIIGSHAPSEFHRTENCLELAQYNCIPEVEPSRIESRKKSDFVFTHSQRTLLDFKCGLPIIL